MDRLSKRRFVIVCHEKVVRIPLEGDEMLRDHGERTQGVVKTLMNTKVDELKLSDSSVTKVSYDLVIFRGEHQCRLLRREAWSSIEVSVRSTEEGEVVTYLRFIVIFFSKIVKPLTSLTERNQKYEWGAEREEAFQTLKNDLLWSKRNDIGMSAQGRGTRRQKCCGDMDQQMRKIRADDGKANVVTDALSRKERVKPKRVRAIDMTIQYGVRGMILATQSEAFKKENILAERLHDGQSERIIQTLEDMLRACVIDFGGRLGCLLPLGLSYLIQRYHTFIRLLLRSKHYMEENVGHPCYRLKLGKILERIGPVAYRLRLPKEFIGVHDTFHVSNLKNCLGNANLHVPLNEIKIDKTLRFVEDLVEIKDCEVKSLNVSRVPL
ncbi:hypothetical protein Tco_0626662 [Tanacetum coccineum]|uniref:Tf2-1-like SH3-like domain-containing protein n=1 Tax=Tanacetum coccineum TaxID=301880 RepID=A0ABQ4WK88_9ASTR